MPDPEGAAMILKALDKLYPIDVDVTELEEQADDIRSRMKEMAQQLQQIRQQRGQESDESYERIYS